MGIRFYQPNLQAEQVILEEQKTVLLSVSLSVHTFLADLSTSSHVDIHHQKLAGELKQEAAELYNLWDLCHHHTSGQFAKVEAALQQLSQVLQVFFTVWYPTQHLFQVQLELGELRAELSLENDALLVRAAYQVAADKA